MKDSAPGCITPLGQKITQKNEKFKRIVLVFSFWFCVLSCFELRDSSKFLNLRAAHRVAAVVAFVAGAVADRNQAANIAVVEGKEPVR